MRAVPRLGSPTGVARRRTGTTITAAGSLPGGGNALGNGQVGAQTPARQAWQSEAWGYFDAFPEFHYGAQFVGSKQCAQCHSGEFNNFARSTHGKLILADSKLGDTRCEACHGPLAKHADDPGSVTPPKLDTAVLCVRCHEANAAKPT